MTFQSSDKLWQRFLGNLPADQRKLAEHYPPGSRWQFKDDAETFYTPIGSTGDGRLLMIRHLRNGTPVQRHDGVDPHDLVPWVEGIPS